MERIVYPGKNFEYYPIPLKVAIAACARKMIPYHLIPIRTEYENVDFSSNKCINAYLLRHQLGFEGFVV
jgi:beta-glucosidase-like glycosyl hydrolase